LKVDKTGQKPEGDLSVSQARVLELLWQACSQECREKCDREFPEARKLVEKALGRPLEIA
jgi:hypothetical protein